MDQNAALARIRELLNDTSPWSEERAEELATLILGLDTCLSNGGYLPVAWARAR